MPIPAKQAIAVDDVDFVDIAEKTSRGTTTICLLGRIRIWKETLRKTSAEAQRYWRIES